MVQIHRCYNDAWRPARPAKVCQLPVDIHAKHLQNLICPVTHDKVLWLDERQIGVLNAVLWSVLYLLTAQL